MKAFRRILFLALMLVSLALVLASCGDDPQPYSVRVVNGGGHPYSDSVIVRFFDEAGNRVKQEVVDENGYVTTDYTEGTYTVEVVYPDPNCRVYYDDTNMTLSEDSPLLVVKMSTRDLTEPTENDQSTTLTVPDGEAHVEISAYHIGVESTYVSLSAGRNYFIFIPEETGTFEFTSVTEGTSVGYYGAPHFVQANNVGNLTADGKISLNIKSGMISDGDGGTTVIVLAVDSDVEQNGIIDITRVGNPTYTYIDAPFTEYEISDELFDYTLSGTLNDFDVTQEYTLVLNEEDGFYHLGTADGELVVVRLTTETEYIASIETVIANQALTRFFFDENGEFVSKEDYTLALLEYIDCCDDDYGVFPLTEDLRYIIENSGYQMGWWNSESGNYLFDGVNINVESAWLFLCCYVTE